MKEKNDIITTQEVVEPEILDEQGRPIHDDGAAGPTGPQMKIYSGILAMAFSFIMLLLMAVFTIFIIFPLMLLGKILGVQVKTFNLRR